MPEDPPRWTPDELDDGRRGAIENFRLERMSEPLEDYLETFDDVRAHVEDLLEMSVDLSQLSSTAVDVLADPNLLEAVRYLASPPISTDDLKILTEASLAPSRLRGNPAMARHVIETVLLGLDRNRFPWVAEGRDATDTEREAAAMASAALIASRRVMTARAHEAKNDQEQLVKDTLIAAGWAEVDPRDIPTLNKAPAAGEFCGESAFGKRKADIVIGMHDGRTMPLECKVSNSSTNSVKRLNNDAAQKAVHWVQQFGTAQTVPGAVLAGVFKRHNLEAAQSDGLTIFWSHELGTLIEFLERAH